MPEKPDSKNSLEDKGKSSVHCGKEKRDTWSEDQKKRSYYYDDASNYQVYLPEDDDEEDKPDK